MGRQTAHVESEGKGAPMTRLAHAEEAREHAEGWLAQLLLLGVLILAFSDFEFPLRREIVIIASFDLKNIAFLRPRIQLTPAIFSLLVFPLLS